MRATIHLWQSKNKKGDMKNHVTLVGPKGIGHVFNINLRVMKKLIKAGLEVSR